MRHTVSLASLDTQGLPPFLKSFVRLGYLFTTPGHFCFCRGRLSVEWEAQHKISVQPLHRRHWRQPQQTGGKVYTVPGRITRPAAITAISERHRRVLVLVERA